MTSVKVEDSESLLEDNRVEAVLFFS